MKHAYLLIAALPNSSAPYWTYLKSPQKNFRRRLYNFLCLKLRGHWTESHQSPTRCTEMIVDYSAVIKIAIFQSVLEFHRDEWRSSSNCGRIAAKIARFNSVSSENIGRKFTKSVHDVTGILPFNLWKQIYDRPIRFRTPKQELKVVPGDVCDHPPNLTDCHSNVPWDNHHDQYVYQTCKVGQDRSRIFWDIWRDMPIFAVSRQKVLYS